MSATDVALLRPPSGLWGYNVQATDAAMELIERLRESTRLRLVSDVPLGAFLSGGVDSSGVVAMMAGLMDDPVKTFAIGFGGGEDELGYAQAVADRYHTNHTAERTSVDYLDTIDEQAAIFGEPFADTSAVPTGRVSELARRGVTVALSGDAGDELFAGYRRYRFHMAAQGMRARIPDGIRQFIPGRFKVLGTDGFGRSDYRRKLRSFFEVDRRHVALAALKALADDQMIPAARVSEAIARYEIDPEGPNPARS